MKYEKDSLLDKWITNFPVKYIFWGLILWLIIIAGLIYLGVQ